MKFKRILLFLGLLSVPIPGYAAQRVLRPNEVKNAVAEPQIQDGVSVNSPRIKQMNMVSTSSSSSSSECSTAWSSKPNNQLNRSSAGRRIVYVLGMTLVFSAIIKSVLYLFKK